MSRLAFQSGKSGHVTKYISRNQALKKLQLSLADFRRLCILKGVYPRVPTKAPSKNSKTTWYHVNDIKYLMQDPIVETLRDEFTFNKKLVKKVGRRELDLAKALADRKPEYDLDHLIKERYPTFEGALRDLDDCVSTIQLYATLPMNGTLNVPNEVILNCQRLAKEWNYIVTSQGLIKKGFISIKGVYLQAVIHDIETTWIVPHKFTPVLPENVDYRVMSTFVEFYQTFLGFILFRLYTEVGLSYPLHTVAKVDSSYFADVAPFTIDNGVYKGLYFAISRECRYDYLEIIIRAAGGIIVEEDNEKLTHIVSDRPNIANKLEKVIYVQPQYIFDSLNSNILLRPEEYTPGKKLPSHLSPFVDNVNEGYIPDRQKEIDAQLGKETVELEQDIVDEEMLEAQEIMIQKRDRWVYNVAKQSEQEKKERIAKLESRKK